MQDNFIHFNNSSLREAVSEATQSVAQFKARLDAISSDIKQVEKWLQTAGFCMHFSVPISFSLPVCENNPELDASFHRDAECLEWTQHQNAWRLVYARERGYGDLDINEVATDWEVLDRKPLIETAAEVRLKCDEYLPEFVKKAASLLPERERQPLNLNN